MTNQDDQLHSLHYLAQKQALLRTTSWSYWSVFLHKEHCQGFCFWISHSFPQQSKIIPFLHLCGTFSLSFWLVAKFLCSDSVIHDYLPVWEEWRLGRGRGQCREERICSWATGKLRPGTFWYFSRLQGSSCLQSVVKWRLSSLLLWWQWEWLVVIITACSRPDWCGDSTRLAWNPLPRHKTSLVLLTTSFSTWLTLQSPEKHVVQNFKRESSRINGPEVALSGHCMTGNKKSDEKKPKGQPKRV